MSTLAHRVIAPLSRSRTLSTSLSPSSVIPSYPLFSLDLVHSFPSTQRVAQYAFTQSFSSSSTRLKKSKAAKVKAKAEEEGGISDEDLKKVLEKVKGKMQKTADWAKSVVYESVQRGQGRVGPALLDSVKVSLPDSPGLVSLNSVASITVKNYVLLVEVWDTDGTKHVESALHKANLPGLSPQRDGNLIRIPVARPTGEIRQQLLKSIHETVETAKTQIRTARTEGMKSLGGRGENGTDDVQELANKFGGEIDDLLSSAKREMEKA